MEDITKKFDIDVIKRKMLVKYPFFGSVVANVEYVENNQIPTAGTNGKIIYYNINFLENLDTSEQIFIFAHEVCHIAFNHILRSENKDIEIWNIATDAVINAFLKKDGLKLVEGGIDIEEAINYDAEQLYEKLLHEKEKQKLKENQSQTFQEQNSDVGGVIYGKGQNNSSTGGSSKGQNNQEDIKQDVGHDTHSMWEAAVKQQKETQTNSNKFNDSNNNKLEKTQEECEKLGEIDSFNKNKEEKKKELEKLKQILAKDATMPSKNTNQEIRNIDNIGRAKPLIDWRYLLRESIKYEVDWSFRNATIEDGVLTPHLVEYTISETEILLDTSGSINSLLLKNFLRECKHILHQSRVKVGCFDTKFYGFTEIRTERDIENMQFIGGGGTDFDVAVNAFSKRVNNRIIFTDGMAYMPNMPIAAIWIVFGNKKITPLGGKVIYITNEQLNKLYNFDSKKYGRSR